MPRSRSPGGKRRRQTARSPSPKSGHLARLTAPSQPHRSSAAATDQDNAPVASALAAVRALSPPRLLRFAAMMCELHRVPFDAQCHAQHSNPSAVSSSSSPSADPATASGFSCIHTIGVLGLLLESAEQQLESKHDAADQSVSDDLPVGNRRDRKRNAGKSSGAVAAVSDSKVEQKSSSIADNQGDDSDDDEAQALIDLTTATEADVLAIVRRRRARCSTAVLRAISCELDEELVRAADFVQRFRV